MMPEPLINPWYNRGFSELGWLKMLISKYKLHIITENGKVKDNSLVKSQAFSTFYA